MTDKRKAKLKSILLHPSQVAGVEQPGWAWTQLLSSVGVTLPGRLPLQSTPKWQSEFMDLFFQIHQDLPRQAPGDNASTQRAFSRLTDLAVNPYILDIGCGPGMQTLELAKLTEGQILALDVDLPFLHQLGQRAQLAGVSRRVLPIPGSMFALPFAARTFNVIWSEGAIYIMGFEQGLLNWQQYLKPKGYLVISELCWLRPQPPVEVQTYWAAGYPGMKAVEENSALIRNAGYHEVEHFVLPASSWWEDYYTPLEARIALLRDQYQGHSEANQLLDEEQLEINIYRKYTDWYGYVFFIMQVA